MIMAAAGSSFGLGEYSNGLRTLAWTIPPWISESKAVRGDLTCYEDPGHYS